MNEKYTWTDGIESALNNIRNKSLTHSNKHSIKYSEFKGYLKYFRVPVIVLAGLNSVFSVGLQPYVDQSIISVLSCSISLTCGVIGSVELFIGIQTMMEKELFSSKDFYILSCDIYKTLSVEREYRMVDGMTYLENMNTKYCNLIEQGNIVHDTHKRNTALQALYSQPDINHFTFKTPTSGGNSIPALHSEESVEKQITSPMPKEIENVIIDIHEQVIPKSRNVVD